MAPSHDAWLMAELTKALGWDEDIVANVVDAISKATTDEQVQELVCNFMGDAPPAAVAVGDAARLRALEDALSGVESVLDAKERELAALRLGVDELRRYGHHDVPLALQSLLPASLATR